MDRNDLQPTDDGPFEQPRRLKRRLVLVFALAIGVPALLLSYGSLRAIQGDRAELERIRREGLEALARDAVAGIEQQVGKDTAAALDRLGPRQIVEALVGLPESAAERFPALVRLGRNLEAAAVGGGALVRGVFVLDPWFAPLFPPGAVAGSATLPGGGPAAGSKGPLDDGAVEPPGAGQPVERTVRRLEARARIVSALDRGRVLEDRGDGAGARRVYADPATDPDDLEGAAWARLALARSLADDAQVPEALSQLALLARLPPVLRTRAGAPVALEAEQRAAELMLQSGSRRDGVRDLLGLYQRMLSGAFGPDTEPIAAARGRVRAVLETWVGPRGVLTGTEPALVARFVQLEAEAWRQRAAVERTRELARLLPDVVAALRAAPPAVGEVSHYTSQGVAGTRLVACQRVADVPGAELPYVVGVVVDLERLLVELVAPRLEELGRQHQALFEVRERRRGVIARGGGGQPVAVFIGEHQGEHHGEDAGQDNAATGAGAGGMAERTEVAFEAFLPFWSLAVAPTRAASDVVGVAGLWLQVALVVLLLVAMVVGARWALKAANRSIELAALKAEFVANVSHELRTPLAAIHMYAEMLKRIPGEQAERRDRYLDTVLRESERLHALIDDILGFSRLEGGTRAYHFQSVRLEDVVQSAADALRPRLEADGAELEVTCAEALPNVDCDPEMLETALRNLMVNAYKYSPPERREVRVAVRPGGAAEVTVEVRDRGVGIAPAENKRLFERFYRGEAARELGVPGSGLGLALVHRVVTDHGGRIEVESTLGEGTTMSVHLPAASVGEAGSEAGRSVPG